MIEVEQ
jgi:membrane-associated phospholipid phosphatase